MKLLAVMNHNLSIASHIENAPELEIYRNSARNLDKRSKEIEDIIERYISYNKSGGSSGNGDKLTRISFTFSNSPAKTIADFLPIM